MAYVLSLALSPRVVQSLILLSLQQVDIREYACNNGERAKTPKKHKRTRSGIVADLMAAIDRTDEKPTASSSGSVPPLRKTLSSKVLTSLPFFPVQSPVKSPPLSPKEQPSSSFTNAALPLSPGTSSTSSSSNAASSPQRGSPQAYRRSSRHRKAGHLSTPPAVCSVDTASTSPPYSPKNSAVVLPPEPPVVSPKAVSVPKRKSHRRSRSVDIDPETLEGAGANAESNSDAVAREPSNGRGASAAVPDERRNIGFAMDNINGADRSPLVSSGEEELLSNGNDAVLPLGSAGPPQLKRLSEINDSRRSRRSSSLSNESGSPEMGSSSRSPLSSRSNSRVRVRLAVSLLQLRNLPQHLVEQRIYVQWAIPGDTLNSNSTRPISVRAMPPSSGIATWPPFPSADTDRPQEIVLRLYLYRLHDGQFVPQRFKLKIKQTDDGSPPAPLATPTARFKNKSIASCTVNIAEYAAHGTDTVVDFHLLGSGGIDVTLMARVRAEWTLSTAPSSRLGNTEHPRSLSSSAGAIKRKSSEDRSRRSINFNESRSSEDGTEAELLSSATPTPTPSGSASASASASNSPRGPLSARLSTDQPGAIRTPRVLKAIMALSGKTDLADSDELMYLYHYVMQLEANLSQAQRELEVIKRERHSPVSPGSTSAPLSASLDDTASLACATGADDQPATATSPAASPAAAPRLTSPKAHAQPAAQPNLPTLSLGKTRGRKVATSSAESETADEAALAAAYAAATAVTPRASGPLPVHASQPPTTATNTTTSSSAMTPTLAALQQELKRLQTANSRLEMQLNEHLTSQLVKDKTIATQTKQLSDAKAKERKLSRKLEQEREDTKTRIADLTVLYEQQLAEKDSLIAFLQSQLGQHR